MRDTLLTPPRYFKSSTILVLLIITFLSSLKTVSAVIVYHTTSVRKVTTAKYQKIQKKNLKQYKRKLKKQIKKTKEVNVTSIILISVGVLILGLILGAIYAIPILWITCLSLLTILTTIGVVFLLLFINAPFGCS